MDRKNVLRAVDEHDVDFVNLQFTDILGTVKNVSIPADKLEDALDDGVYFDGSSIDGFVRIQESDMRLEPDPETFTLLPWKERNGSDITTARLICDVRKMDGEPFEGDPRHILKRQIERAEKLGFELNVGPEPEFFVFETEDNGKATTRPHDAGGYFDLAPKDLAEKLRKEIVLTLGEMGFDVEASHHEVASGQHEIDFKYGEALKTADNIATFRSVVRAVSELHDVHATFMPKPISDINGSGMHTHLSLFKGGENVFYDRDDDFGLSDVAYKFLGGILEHAPAITAVCNPTVNSYKRLVPGYEAPVYIAWSDVNRSALVRIPSADDQESTRVELRSPDPSCNPYLALAVILAAGLDGIENDIRPPEAVRENIYDFTEEKREERGIEMLPSNLKEAIEALKDDKVVKEALGVHTAAKFIEAKEHEWDDYKSFVSEWEEDRYLETF